MRVALVCEWLDAARGGAETSTLQFIDQVCRHDVQLHVLTRSAPTLPTGVTCQTLTASAWSRTAQSLAFRDAVERELQRQSFDIVHAVTPCRSADIYQPRGGTVAESIQRNLAFRSGALSRGIKHCANGFNVKQRRDLAAERAIMHGTPVIAALSHYVVRQLQQHYHLPDQRIRLVFNGITLTPRPAETRAAIRAATRGRLGLSERDCLIILIAHNFKLKGVARWMEALSMLVSSGVTHLRSLVIGKGVTPAWRRLQERLGLTQVLTFTGASAEVADLRDAADVLVHPTYYDPCSRVVLEALACGLPCVASRWDGAAEKIDPGISGFILDDPSDTRALAEFVRHLLDPALRQSMSRAAEGLAESVSMARHAREMVELYARVRASRATA